MTRNSYILCAGALIGLAAAPQIQAQGAPTGGPAPTTLPDVTVSGERPAGLPVTETTAGPVKGYQALTSRSATKTETPPEQVPQSIQIITRSQIDDQRPASQSELFRSISGVQPVSLYSGGQLTPSVRGLAGERFIDGLPNYYDYGARDFLVNVERVEVLKGPASILYQGGPNPVGGIVNIVSKLPTAQRFAEAGMTFGGYRLWSPYFDVNQPISDNILVRVTGQYETTNSYTDTIRRESYQIDPTITFTNGRGTKLTLHGELSQRRQHEFSGLPTVGTLLTSGYSVRRNMYVGPGTMPKVESRKTALTARFDHEFNDVWSSFTTARISRGRFREPAQLLLGNSPDFAPSTFTVWNGYLNEDNTEQSVNTNVIAKFDVGISRNRFLLSADYNRVTDKGIFPASPVAFVDFANPVFPAFVYPPDSLFTTFTKINNTYVQSGLTGQIQSSLWGRVHLLGALRLGHVDIKSRELTTNSSFHTTKTRVLPRIGVVVDALPGVSPFIAYSEGLRAVPFFQGTNAPKPESSDQIEGGVKLNLGFGLSGTLALFEIHRRNVATTPTGSFTQVQTGEQRSRGFEADLLWQPDAHWAVTASYAHLDAEVSKDGNAALVGKALVGVPRDSARMWVQYRFLDGALDGLGLGGGFYAAAKQTVELGNPVTTPSYAIFDAAATYSWRNLSFALAIKNIADRKYYVPYTYLSGRVAPADGRTAYATVAVKF